MREFQLHKIQIVAIMIYIRDIDDLTHIKVQDNVFNVHNNILIKLNLCSNFIFQ